MESSRLYFISCIGQFAQRPRCWRKSRAVWWPRLTSKTIVLLCSFSVMHTRRLRHVARTSQHPYILLWIWDELSLGGLWDDNIWAAASPSSSSSWKLGAISRKHLRQIFVEQLCLLLRRGCLLAGQIGAKWKECTVGCYLSPLIFQHSLLPLAI